MIILFFITMQDARRKQLIPIPQEVTRMRKSIKVCGGILHADHGFIPTRFTSIKQSIAVGKIGNQIDGNHRRPAFHRRHAPRIDRQLGR